LRGLHRRGLPAAVRRVRVEVVGLARLRSEAEPRVVPAFVAGVGETGHGPAPHRVFRQSMPMSIEVWRPMVWPDWSFAHPVSWVTAAGRARSTAPPRDGSERTRAMTRSARTRARAKVTVESSVPRT